MTDDVRRLQKASHRLMRPHRARAGGAAESCLGATPLPDGRCRFLVWAPNARKVEVRLVTERDGDRDRLVALEPTGRGYFAGVVDDVLPGALYLYRLDEDVDRPDPASRKQPRGVHGPSEVVDPRFAWSDHGWVGPPLQDYIVYELHVGTFTGEGTFEAAIRHLPELVDLGVTAIELMPIAQFPGDRNWGYDGTHPFAAQSSYGGLPGLQRLVDACHRAGLAVVLDLVYNHIGPEGNYLSQFGPYFTERYQTPWGQAVNFDGEQSDAVRRFFIDNALFWVTEAHVDALRLDAVHAIMDQSAHSFLEELTSAVHAQAERLGRRVQVIAESNLNDPRLVRPRELGGVGMDAQWNDDFHHALHALLTGESDGYYADYGALQQMAKAYREGFVYTGEYSKFRERRHGRSARDLAAQRFVVFAQNHDQIGNRMRGDRLTQLVSFAALKVAAGAVLLSPFVPLIFMGEEYGETAPFPYFVSHSDPHLVEAVRQGRRREFEAFTWNAQGPPDPQDPRTFESARLDHRLSAEGRHRALLEYHKALIRLRTDCEALRLPSNDNLEVIALDATRTLVLRRWFGADAAVTVLHFGREPATVTLPVPPGRWHKRLDAAEPRWHGPGSAIGAEVVSDGELRLELPAETVVVFTRHEEP